jgi:AraC family transcriptional regulator of adaptative response/methylated-DNA-[protein]-cysteine methyltransferase
MAAHIRLIDAAVITPPNLIEFGWGMSPVGHAFIAWDSVGVRYLSLAGQDRPQLLNDRAHDLVQTWPSSTLVENASQAARLIDRIFEQRCPLPVVLQGTEFQRRVWRELVRVPSGQIAAYSDLADRLQMPGASRAIGGALAANRIAYLIPCHRILRKNGEIGQFRWGVAVKAGLLQWESHDRVMTTSLKTADMDA